MSESTAEPHPAPLAVHVGGVPLHQDGSPVEGSFVRLDGHDAYRIDHVDGLDPFFVTVVSDVDHWLFASSTGALTAGRGVPERALFPYETVDRIHDAQDRTGSKTVLLVGQGDRWELWEPFSPRYDGLHAVRRSLTKTLQGDRLQYREVNDDLGLSVAVTWSTSERYGFVKTTRVRNHGDREARVRVLDGVQNLMPYGVSRDLQETRSVLANAYKKNELVPGTTLGLFTLSAIPVDRAEPSEALKATTVWSAGVEPDAILLSTRQLDRFRAGQPVETETAVKAERGAYFVASTLALGAGESATWDTVAEIEQDAADVVALADALDDADALRQSVRDDVDAGTRRLRQLVAGADGEQRTGERLTTARHRMNVLFNVMRGGTFDAGYTVTRAEVKAHVTRHNAAVAHAQADWLDGLPERLSARDLVDQARARDPQLARLCANYLPLSFSRRHGDPSRPWNHFSIDGREPDGSMTRGYEGNWRDIFQNWEALGRSFPEYLESFISVFVGASTADGYNPYRITDHGIDWETIEPDDPWSYIGYWGDHQIIYLLRLLALSQAHHPDRLATLLGERRFSYANVPYRIKPYADLVRDPHDTVVYDADEEDRIAERVSRVGADGKLLWDGDGVRLVTLAEKLLVPLLAKLTNLVPGGGIWMNTQRPEWNDANNALVGYGISMVTLFAVRRYLTFLDALLADAPGDSAELSTEVADLLDRVSDALADASAASDQDRQRTVDALGQAGSDYRQGLYTRGLSGQTRAVPFADVRQLLDRARDAADETIRANRRDDGLYHAYNLLHTDGDGASVQHLYAMLEGQVAALDAGVLSGQESLDVLRALRASDIYRADQHSYRLYPDRDLGTFLDKNHVPADAASSGLLRRLLDAGDESVVVQDVRGGVHFNGAFRNKTDLEAALDRLAASGAEVSERDRADALAVFERVFDHRAYTGRSGTFFGYEGLGSIYWHMVSKLALAAQESTWRAIHAGADADTVRQLADAYYDIRAGLGVGKTPEEFGAFPADAYSHTPGGGKARQPGMTGQVKEDILCRWGELGLHVRDGRLSFETRLLRADELTQEPTTFRYVDLGGAEQSIELDAGQLAFTYCGVPVVYRRAETPAVRVSEADGEPRQLDGAALSREMSAEVFQRTGAVARIDVDVVPAL